MSKVWNHFCSTMMIVGKNQTPNTDEDFHTAMPHQLKNIQFWNKVALYTPVTRATELSHPYSVKHVHFRSDVNPRFLIEKTQWVLNCLCCRAISRQPCLVLLANNKKCLPMKRRHFPMGIKYIDQDTVTWPPWRHAVVRWNLSIVTGQYPWHFITSARGFFR